jgi:dUTP pyrophosphatase
MPSRERVFASVVEQMKEAMRPKVKFKALREGIPDPPEYKTKGSAGADVRSAAGFIIPPGGTRMVPTGYAMQLPDGYEGQLRSRSGLALRHGITVLNSPGTIDSDYRGEVCVLLHNHSAVHYEIEIGQRVAQLIVTPVQQARFELVEELDVTERGEGGFGSTGQV